MIKIFRIALILTILMINTGVSQTKKDLVLKKDTVLLLTGGILTGVISEIAPTYLVLKESEKISNGSTIETDRIFSYTNKTGEHVLYYVDSTAGNEFTVSEMRYFIRGEQDGKKGFKARPAFFTNMIIGIAGGISGTFFFPIPAFTFATLVGLPKVKIKQNTVRYPTDLNHPTYVMGYERMARRNRKIQSLIGGGIGLVAGLGTFLILQSYDIQLIK
jgi:hypothetical protein